MASQNSPLSKARKPQRVRGKERFSQLLDATADILADHMDTDVTLAMVADRAGVPLPSVYHFFPNRNAIFVELARRYHQELAELSRMEITPPPSRWQDLVLIRQTRGRDYLNANPAALRLFMGAGVSVEVRTLDLRGNTAASKTRAQEFRARFECAGLTDLEHWLAVTFGLMDGIWAISYAEHGHITDRYLMEAWRASVAYLRTYLPEDLPLKSMSNG